MMFTRRKSIREALSDQYRSDTAVNNNKLNECKLNENKLKEIFSINSSSAPWYVHMMLILGSWLGVLLIFVAIVMQLNIKNNIIFIFFGVTLAIVAILLSRLNTQSNFIQHLSIPISLLGLVSFITGIAQTTNSIRTTALLVISIEVVVFIFYTYPVRRFICAWSIPIALIYLLYSKTSLYPYQIIFVLQIFLSVYLWEYKSKLLQYKKSDYLLPAMFGIISGLLILLLLTVYRDKISYGIKFDYNQWWLTTATVALAFLYVIRNALNRFNAPNNSYAIYTGLLVIIIAILTYDSPGVLASLMVIIIAYSHGSRILFGIAVTFLLFFISAYYYNLSFSLLYKSISLMASGILVLLAAWFMRRLSRSNSNSELERS